MDQDQTPTAPAPKKKTRRPNNAYILAGAKCCEAIEERNDMVLCKVFQRVDPLFTDPCDSRIIGCFRVKRSECVMKLVPECELTKQALMIEEPQKQTNVFMTVLHDF